MGVRIYARLGKNIAVSMPLRLRGNLIWYLLAIIMSMCHSNPRRLHGATLPADTLLVDVELVGVGHTVVEAVLTRDSLLLLPARPVHDLCGLPAPTTTWTTPDNLRAQWPTVTVTVDLRRLIVVIYDGTGVLPATRRVREQVIREARGAPQFAQSRSGLFLAVAGDERQHHVTDFGYSWRGRVAVQGRYASAFGSAWAASWAPSRKFFVSYSDAERQPATVSGRLATGPFWIAPTWQEHRPVAVDGLVALGPVKLFASSRDVYVLTIQSRAGDFQVGRSRGITAARLSWGPIPASPFSPPFVP